MRLAFGADHAGFELVNALLATAESAGNTTSRFGALKPEPYDYPDAADGVVGAVLSQGADLGVLVCGTGIGMSIRANRYRGVRAAVCCSTESARLARLHNHANVLCLGSRTASRELSELVMLAFLETQEDHDERHERRVRKLDGDVSLAGIVE